MSRSHTVVAMRSCPRCSSSNLTRDGHDERGRVVYACGGCGRHATSESGSLVSGHRFRRDVILLADTFNRWFEPENLRAALRVLTAAGYPDGFSIDLDAPNFAPFTNMAQSVQSTMAQGGIKVNIISAEMKPLLTKYRAEIRYWDDPFGDFWHRLDDMGPAPAVARAEAQMRDMLFAFRVAKHVKSNAIVFAGGAHPMSRPLTDGTMQYEQVELQPIDTCTHA